MSLCEATESLVRTIVDDEDLARFEELVRRIRWNRDENDRMITEMTQIAGARNKRDLRFDDICLQGSYEDWPTTTILNEIEKAQGASA